MLLTFDDALMLHDVILPKLLSVPDPLLYVAYLLLLVVYLARFRRHIMGNDYSFLGAALVSFAASVLMDILTDTIVRPGVDGFFEDALEFVGIVFWLGYFVLTAVAAVQRS